MPRTIHFRVEGETEKFLQEMNKVGLTERDVFAKALGLLNLVYKTGRVAFLSSDAEQRKYANEIIDFVFTLEDLEPAKQKGASKSSKPESATKSNLGTEEDTINIGTEEEAPINLGIEEDVKLDFGTGKSEKDDDDEDDSEISKKSSAR